MQEKSDCTIIGALPSAGGAESLKTATLVSASTMRRSKISR
jgi:hypothetical protein